VQKVKSQMHPWVQSLTSRCYHAVPGDPIKKWAGIIILAT